MKIMVRSKREAQEISFVEPHAMISINEVIGSGYADATLKTNDNTLGVLILRFDDTVSLESWKECGWPEVENREPVLFNEDMAQQVIDFYNQHKGKAETILVHCHAGISRSAAIGSCLMQFEGQDPTKLMVPPKHPNVLVRSLIMRHAWGN